MIASTGAGIAVVPTLFGPMIVPPYDSYVGRALIENGVYGPDEFAGWAPYINTGDVVVDGGANLGSHTMAMSERVGETGVVIAVEAQRLVAGMLAGSAALQNRRNVFVRQCALGQSAGVLKVPTLDYTASNNFGGLSLPDVADGESVAVVPLDAWRMSRLDFLKLDVEGMEVPALNGAHDTVMRCRPVIVAECEHNYAPLLDWFLNRDYRLFLQTPLLGAQWPSVRSKNLLCLPRERALPDPDGADIRELTELALPTGE